MSDLPVEDPLKARQGFKRPLEHKQDKIQQLYQDQKRYYPVNIRGNVDEWAAIERNRVEAYQREQAEAQIQKSLAQKNYALELEKAMQNKKENEKIEKMQLKTEREFMEKAVDARNAQERGLAGAKMGDRDKFATDARNVRIEKAAMEAQKARELADADQQMIARNREASAMFEAAQQANNQARRDILQHAYSAQIQEKGERTGRERFEQKLPTQMAPNNFGYGYQNQRNYLDEVDKNQDRVYANYQERVTSPARNKAIQQIESDWQKEREAKQRMDAAQDYINQQQVKQQQAHSKDLRSQVAQMKDARILQDQTEKQADQFMMQKQIAESQRIDKEIQQKRAKDMNDYNTYLQQQQHAKHVVHGYGTMTQTEKQMNKQELRAYKEYGGSNFSLVPGIQNEKPITYRGAVVGSPQMQAMYNNATKSPSGAQSQVTLGEPLMGGPQTYGSPQRQGGGTTPGNTASMYTNHFEQPRLSASPHNVPIQGSPTWMQESFGRRSTHPKRNFNIISNHQSFNPVSGQPMHTPGHAASPFLNAGHSIIS